MPTMKKISANNILNIYKPVGISPLDAIKALKEKYPELKGEKMTYAGRLDPMAEGVLLILAGKTVYEKEKYLKLDKEYEGEILFGFETDTSDVLGLPEKTATSRSRLVARRDLDVALKKFEGEISLPLPPYSSYKIKGKPLFQWAREGKLSEIEIPIRQTKINSIKLLSLDKISGQNLMKEIEQKINLVKGDFRQEEILNRWQKMLPKSCATKSTSIFVTPWLTKIGRSSLKMVTFWIAKVKISCSSGTYIRSIAHKLGRELKTGATLFSYERSELENKKYSCGGVLLSLKRTKVGNFDIKDSLRI